MLLPRKGRRKESHYLYGKLAPHTGPSPQLLLSTTAEMPRLVLRLLFESGVFNTLSSVNSTERNRDALVDSNADPVENYGMLVPHLIFSSLSFIVAESGKPLKLPRTGKGGNPEAFLPDLVFLHCVSRSRKSPSSLSPRGVVLK